jgi:signal transduction histidine kinase
MWRWKWPIVSIIASFACLGVVIIASDANNRLESSYRDTQVLSFEAYSEWSAFIGSLKGALTTTSGLRQTLDEAIARRARIEAIVRELRAHTAALEPALAKALESFISSIEAGMKLASEIIDNGFLLLSQADLPLAYREGRLGLSSLSGKDATAELGPLASYQYFQLVRRIRGLNVVFDALYSERLEAILEKVAEGSRRLEALFFGVRVGLIALSSLVIGFTLVRLYRMNKKLSGIADTASKELDTAKSHLIKAEGSLRGADFTRSLFDMVAGLSHELNTPLGNCVALASHMEGSLIALSGATRDGCLSTEDLDAAIAEGIEGFGLMRAGLDQMRLQIETFKLLSAVNEGSGGPSVRLSEFLERVLPELARSTGIEAEVDREGADPELALGDLELIFGELLKNSREHGGAARARIRARAEEGIVEIDYEDDGAGIPQSELARLAEPFYTTARGRGHMGLGLSIAASLITNKLRGSIEFSSPGKGFRAKARLRPYERPTMPAGGSSPLRG